MGLSLTGSDWRRVERKAKILMVCNSDYYFFPQPNPEAGGAWRFFLLVRQRGSTNIQGGRGNIAGEVCKIVHAHVNPNPHKKKGTRIISEAQAVAAQLHFGMRDLDKEDGSRNI